MPTAWQPVRRHLPSRRADQPPGELVHQHRRNAGIGNGDLYRNGFAHALPNLVRDGYALDSGRESRGQEPGHLLHHGGGGIVRADRDLPG